MIVPKMFAKPRGGGGGRLRKLIEIGSEMPTRDHRESLGLQRALIGPKSKIREGDFVLSGNDD
jgi:hypothetical protein